MNKGLGTTSGYLHGAEFLGIMIFQIIAGILSENLIKSGIIYMNIILLFFTGNYCSFEFQDD